MKIRWQQLPLSLLVLQLLPIIQSVSSDHLHSLGSKKGRATVSTQGSDRLTSTGAVTVSKPTSASSLGTKDAPVDGKDGRPHQGPFVETAAERDRKKAKESGEDEVPPSTKKPTPKDGWNAAMPESNDGVMDDPDRKGPKEGTRGTEGGISKKNSDKKAQENADGLKSEKTPEKPKEIPSLPHSEQNIVQAMEDKEGLKTDKVSAKTKGEDDKLKSKGKGIAGLEKPNDLPEKPHDIPHPIPTSAAKIDPLKISKPPTAPTLAAPKKPTSIIQPLHSFVLSLTMIIFSEIGDKTFLIAALMAMKHPPLFVFSAAFPALIVMTILSAVLGHAVPTLIPARFTNFAAALLFLVFGAKMLKEGYAIRPGEGVGEEMKEVELELEEKEQLAQKMGRRRSSATPYMLEAGRLGARKSRSGSRLPAPPASPPMSPESRSPSPSRISRRSNLLAGVNNLFSLLLSPAWVQTFVMTFLGEWGDRSQIATIAMAAGQDYWWVTGGALTGHAICLAVAVIGGRAIAGRVSLRVVTLGGAFAFLVFGVIYLLEALYYK